jgi:hypothetical protein
MISINLQGGLSNQMFQIATAYAYGLRNDFEVKFDLDMCQTPNQGFKSSKYKETLFKNLECYNSVKDNQLSIINEQEFSYNKLSTYENIILNGYFQSEKYFIDYKSEIQKLFYFPLDIVQNIEKYLKDFNHKKIVTVHVRRGDYLKLPLYHPVCSLEYYKKAMEEIGDANYIFVSDDIQWCKENFIGSNIYFSPFSDELHDLYLMSTCAFNIIANSSFSWWGAWLNNTKYFTSKTIIAPKQWFGINGPQDTQDLIPTNWIKI